MNDEATGEDTSGKGTPSKGTTSTERTPPKTVRAQPFAVLLLAAAGVTGLLALLLFVAFYTLGFSGAPYWSVGAAVVGGIVMRRMLLPDPSISQTVLFTLCTIGAAVGGLWLGNVLLS